MSGEPAAARLDGVSRALALCAILIGAWLYLGRLGAAHLQRGNEAMYASPPIQMLSTGDWLVPQWEHKSFLDKPPLTYWIVAAGYRVLGVSVFTAKLPGALAGLATALLLGAWVARRSGRRAGLLAGLILVFSFQFNSVCLTFAADAFLTIAVTLAVIACDVACRRPDGRDALLGIGAGAALAAAFYAKGLVGIALPLGAVAAGLLLDRAMPVRPVRRCAWGLAALLLLVVPWHWALDRRLGAEFWQIFYWENQFLRGATPKFMQMSRGPLFYLGVLAWGIFPWSLQLPAALGGRRVSRVFLGWFLLGLAFWSLLVMKREVYFVTVLPAVAALVAESLSAPTGFARAWRRPAWILAALVPCAALIVLARASDRLAELAGGRSSVIVLAVGLAALAAALIAAAARPESARTPFAVLVGCGLLLLGLQNLDLALGRLDPLPDWGERVRAECAQRCDGFLFGNNFNSVDFYSRFDWTMLAEPARLPGALTHRKGYLVMWTSMEPHFAGVPLKWEVVDRRPAFRGGLVATALGLEGGGLDSLSLVRVEKP